MQSADIFDWDVKVRRWDNKVIGRLVVMPGVEFEVTKWNSPIIDPSKPRSDDVYAPDRFEGQDRIGYGVGYEVWGCTGQRLVMVAREDVEAYLLRQEAQTPAFQKVKAKRDAVQARMKPLQRKWEQTNAEIDRLVKA